MNAFTEDRIEAIHASALEVLEDLGIKVLLPEARALFRSAGARVDEASEMVWIGREIVEAALATCPRSIEAKGGARHRDVTLELGSLVFQPGAGAPHATDLVRGRRPGSAQDLRELIKLTQSFDVLQMVPTLVEAQDVEPRFRHYAMLEPVLTMSDKCPFVYSRGRGQVSQCFEMVQEFRGLSDAEFAANPWMYTVINTNSPRQIDMPMALGTIDFARAGQLLIVTPFTLIGAMAPITVAGAMTLSHAEALAAITLNQLAKPGAPVCYGTFTSNVDMKSGAPAFGTPEHFTASLVAGQLARKLGLPWRSAAGSAANIGDAQSAGENQMGLWGCLLGGATIVVHSAGWLEGGLTVSYEALVTDTEVLQMIGDLCTPRLAGDDEIGLDALREVMPGGHFFATGQTMQRYTSEFYQPVVHDYANFGTWEERGGQTATERATAIWQDRVAQPAPRQDPARVAALQDYITRMTEAGGAVPES
jgi:trimethylamine--corrinoid protein Co-methyltransferase